MEKKVPCKPNFLLWFNVKLIRVSFLLFFAIFNFSVAWGQNTPQVYNIKITGQNNLPVYAAKINYSEITSAGSIKKDVLSNDIN